MSNVITKFYKIINPQTALVSVEDSHDLVGNYGLYGNYSWFNKLIQGSASRQQRYREYDMMDNDTDMRRALDIYAQEITGNNPKTDLPLKIEITSGNEQTVSSITLTTLQAALRSWIKIHQWDLYMFPTIRNTIKYGDCFYMRGKNLKNRWTWIHPKNVVAAVTPSDDVTKVKFWQIRTDVTDARDDYNTTAGLVDNNDTYNMKMYKADEIIHFHLHDDLGDEAPFSRSIFTDVYTTFKQKQMLEDAVLIYRITRAPEKRVFKVEVGNMPPQARGQYLNTFKNEIKQRKIPTPHGGSNQIESIYSPISQNEDIFLTQKDGKGTTIETLPGGQSLGELQEVDYFYRKIWRGLGIPLSYIDANSEGSSISDGKVGIAYMQELQFILKIEQLQKHFEVTFDEEFKRFLHENNINVDNTIFRVVLPEPSNYKKSRDNAINVESLNVASAAKNLGVLSTRYILSKYLNMTKAEIIENERLRAEELGLDPNDTRRNMAKIYNPENSDSGGFDGGLTDGQGLSGFEDTDITDQETSETSETENQNSQNNNNKNQQK